MALNPEISLGIRPQQPVALPAIHSPLDRYQKMLTLRHLMQQGQLGQMNIEQTRLENERLQREAQNEQSLGSWMQQNQRPDLTPQEIVSAHPNPTGIKFATAWSAQKTAALNQHKAGLDVAFEEAKTDDRIYNSVTDDNSKLAALTELVRLKRIDGAQASRLAAIPFDSPEFKGIQQRVAAQSQDRLQRIEAKQKEIALRIAETTEKSATAGGIAEGEKKAIDAAQAQKAADAATVAAAFDQSPEAGAAVLATLAKNPKRFEPFQNVTTAEQARTVGSTVGEQATGARAKATAEQQLWTDPGGLIAIKNDPKRSPEDKARADKGIQLHENLKRAGATTMMITPNQNIANEAKLRDDYSRDTKDYVAIRNAYSKITSAAKASSAVGDMSLVFGLMKLQDPGSTVRENEQADARNTAGVPEIIRNTWNRLLSGERLSPAQRADMVARAREIYDQSYADYGKTKEMYSGIATRGGMNPQNVVIDLTPATPVTPEGPKKHEKGSDPGRIR